MFLFIKSVIRIVVHAMTVWIKIYISYSSAHEMCIVSHLQCENDLKISYTICEYVFVRSLYVDPAGLMSFDSRNLDFYYSY